MLLSLGFNICLNLIYVAKAEQKREVGESIENKRLVCHSSGPLPTAHRGVWEMLSLTLLRLARRLRCLRVPCECVRVSVLYFIWQREGKHV